jgi:hypothetical protein
MLPGMASEREKREGWRAGGRGEEGSEGTRKRAQEKAEREREKRESEREREEKGNGGMGEGGATLHVCAWARPLLPLACPAATSQ